MPQIDGLTTFRIGVELELMTCNEPGCGIQWAAPVEWFAARRRDKKRWSCPNMHERVFVGKSREEELREELKRSQATVTMFRESNARLEDRNLRLKRQNAAQRGVATRLRNKAIAGLCAFCTHEFPNVAAHVAEAHPGEQLQEDPEGDPYIAESAT